MEEREMKYPFTPLILESFWKNYTLYGYYALTPPNNLVGWYVKYIWYVEKVSNLSHDLTMCNCILITPHNIKYSKFKIQINI
jgi:hypothetical protein